MRCENQKEEKRNVKYNMCHDCWKIVYTLMNWYEQEFIGKTN